MQPTNRDRERLVIWLNGGPGWQVPWNAPLYVMTSNGSSSFDGALMEIGPVRLNAPDKEGDRPTLREIQGAWNEYANVLFLDQPAGTGYSYVSTNRYVHELDVAADHVVDFLRRFYQVFPEFQNMDTYITGESFAGQYIPYTARAVLASAEIETPLRGIIIGNGWMSPAHQYPAYLPFALDNGILTPGDGHLKQVQNVDRACNQTMGDTDPAEMSIHIGVCEGVLSSVIDSTVQSVNGKKLCINTYDIRLTDTYPSCGMNWPPDLANMYEYLPRDDVKSAFHASAKEGGWVECSGSVSASFDTPNSKPAYTLLPELLEEMPVLLFAGDQDLICNWLGISNMIDSLAWNGETGFGDARELEWTVNGEHAGLWTTARNLTFVKIANASHMAPFDVPLTTHDMLLRFMNTDFMSAAGSAAKVPSRIGAEQEAVIGTTSPNGTALDAHDAKTVLDASASAKAVENSLTAYYNAGSAAVLLLLLAAVAAIFFCLRRQVRQELANNPNLGSYEAADNKSPPGTPKRRRTKEHRRGFSTASSVASKHSKEEQAHEMESLVAHREDAVQPFALGDDEDEDGFKDRPRGRSDDL